MFSAKFIRFAFRKFRVTRQTFQASTQRYAGTSYCKSYYSIPAYVPSSLGFSFLTLLGLEKETNQEDELIKSIKYSILFIQRSEFDRAERLLHVALRQAQQLFNEKGVTYIYDVMANLALEREQLEKAKKLFVSVAQRLMQGGATEDDIKIIHISLKLARISHLQKEYETAQTGFEWCMNKLTKEYRNNPTETIKKLLAMAEDWYGKLYVDCNNAEKGLQLLLSSRERTRSIEDFGDEHTVIQLNDIATVCEKLDRLEESEQYLKEAVQLGTALPQMADLGAIHVNLGRVYLKRGLVDQARKACGYGWRLGYDRDNAAVKKQALQCVEEVNRAEK